LGTSGEGADADRQLSAVERGLLSDIVAAVANAVSAASRQAGGPGFRHSEGPPQGEPDLPGEDFSEYCELSVRPSGSADERLLSVVILSDVLAGVCQGPAARKAERRAEDVTRDLLAHVNSATVVATARLGRLELSMRDILSLEPGDVLLMQQRVDEPIDLLVEGAVLLSGFPAKSSGKYALKIASADGGSTGD
jgi:flagellar motor switch protein FliM